jgi:aminoglycoside phosphotransferase family enzyme
VTQAWVSRSPACLARAPPAALPLETKVAFLRAAANYPESTDRVDAVETRMSWVFLLDQFVYKLKKPVCCELLDFRTLAARHYFCEEELRLNRRLAPNIYLGVVPLTLHGGHLALDGGGKVLDWLVRMRRVPGECMLLHRLKHGSLKDADLARVAARLAAFHATLAPQAFSCAQYRARFARRIGATVRELGRIVDAGSARRLEALREAQLAALRRHGDLLDERVHAGHVVDGHGDLRPEHVYLGEPPGAIDCLEFSRALRVADVADELGFLALECERLGAPAVGQALLHLYGVASGDRVPPILLHFYQSCRAATRALIAARHLEAGQRCGAQHWLHSTGDYLRLAEEHVARGA